MSMKKRGFTIFFAVLVASLALAVGLSIYDILVRELALSQTATQSQYAIYAADTGAECALYWDAKYTNASNNNNGGSNSAFATSSFSTILPSGSLLWCNGSDISTVWTFPAPPVNPAAGAATTSFQILTGPSAASPCALVTVAKVGNPSQTTVVSHGYNTCSSTGIVRLERALQVSY